MALSQITVIHPRPITAQDITLSPVKSGQSPNTRWGGETFLGDLMKDQKSLVIDKQDGMDSFLQSQIQSRGESWKLDQHGTLTVVSFPDKTFVLAQPHDQNTNQLAFFPFVFEPLPNLKTHLKTRNTLATNLLTACQSEHTRLLAQHTDKPVCQERVIRWKNPIHEPQKVQCWSWARNPIVDLDSLDLLSWWAHLFETAIGKTLRFEISWGHVAWSDAQQANVAVPAICQPQTTNTTWLRAWERCLKALPTPPFPLWQGCGKPKQNHPLGQARKPPQPLTAHEQMLTQTIIRQGLSQTDRLASGTA